LTKKDAEATRPGILTRVLTENLVAETGPATYETVKGLPNEPSVCYSAAAAKVEDDD
jgi:hypothetical protein